MDTLKELNEVIYDLFGSNEVNSDTNLINDLGIDSLDFSTLIVEVEERFGISLPDDVFDIRTVGELVDLIDQMK